MDPTSNCHTKHDGTSDTALSNIDLTLNHNNIYCVIGAVGSGKSALLQALVGELPVSDGRLIRRSSSLAYAAQDPWIMNGTLRDNIVVGTSGNHDPTFYHDIVRACGLDVDFTQLLRGDLTAVGDRGVQLSGGQRARVGLARALYQNPDVLVVDDPLSAVDAGVGQKLWEQALAGPLKRDKCVVMATHQCPFASDGDEADRHCQCVLMTDGRVSCVGSYEDCVAASNGKLKTRESDSSVDLVAVGNKDE